MPDPAKELVRLAMERFGNLWPAEAKMLRAAAEGTVADVADQEGDEKLTRESAWGCWEQWGEHRKIRAELLRWVLVNDEAAGLVHEHGVMMIGAHVVGHLDLFGARSRSMIIWKCCAIPQSLQLSDLRIPLLSLDGCHTGPVLADRLQADSDVYLRNGLVVRGPVRLVNAKVGGSLDCSRSSFANCLDSSGSSRIALDATNIDVSLDLLLSCGVSAKGEVCLANAKIGGDLDCRGSTFENPPGVGESSGVAMRAQGVNVAGGVFLREGASAKGEVCLANAKIGGDLDCRGSTFENPPEVERSTGRAIFADGIRIGRNLFLRADDLPCRTALRGALTMVGGEIGGDLQIQGLDCDGHISVERAIVEQALWLDDDSDVRGSFDLSDASVAYIHDSKDAWTDCVRVNLHGFRYNSFTDECDMTVEDRIAWVAHGGVNSEAQAAFPAEPYQQLARVYASMGRADDAVKVRQAQFRARREHERPRSFWDISGSCWYWWRWLVIRLLGCGYNRLGPLYAMFVLWLVGGLVFQAANRQGLMVPASDQVLTTSEYQQESGRKVPLDYQPMNVWTYSADAMLPFIDLHQERFWLPKRDPDPDRWRAIANLDRGTVFGYPFPDAGRFVRWYLWFHIAAGWVLSTLFVVGLSGIVKNEDGKTQDE